MSYRSTVWPEDVRPLDKALTVQLPDEDGDVGDSNTMYKLIPVNEYDLDKRRISYERVGFAHFRVMAISITLIVFGLLTFASGAVLFVYGPVPPAISDYYTAFVAGLFFLLTAALGISASAKLKDCPIAGMMVLSVLGAMSGAAMLAMGAFVLLAGSQTATDPTISLAMHILVIICGLIGLILCLTLSGMSCRALCCGRRHFTVTVHPGRKPEPRIQILPVPMAYPVSPYAPRSVEMSYTGRHSPDLLKQPISDGSQEDRRLDGESLPPATLAQANAQEQANLKRWKLNKGLLKTVNVLYGIK